MRVKGHCFGKVSTISVIVGSLSYSINAAVLIYCYINKIELSVYFN